MRAVICFVMAVLLSNVQVAMAADASAPQMISTMSIVEEMSRSERVKNITELISRDDIQVELEKVGLSKDEVTRRLASLSDSEIRDLTKQLDQARYGGDGVGGILIIVVLVLLIIFLAKRV